MAANQQVPEANVRALHVLAPAPMKTGPTAAAAPEPAPHPAAPVKRRTPPDGYRYAIEAHRQAARPSKVDPAIAKAVERQTAAMRELSHRVFPEPGVVADDASAPIEQARLQRRLQRRHQAAATEAAALRRARAERAAREVGAPSAEPQTAPLGRTA